MLYVHVAHIFISIIYTTHEMTIGLIQHRGSHLSIINYKM